MTEINEYEVDLENDAEQICLSSQYRTRRLSEIIVNTKTSQHQEDFRLLCLRVINRNEPVSEEIYMLELI